MIALLLFPLIASGFGTVNDDDWPPARFRGVGTTTVTFVRTQAEIDHLCGKSPRGMTTEACADNGRVILPDPCAFSGDLARIECHELAHRFGGWNWKHPR